MSSPERRADLEAAVRARRELGPDYDDALVQSFVDGIDAEIDRRIATRLEGEGRGGVDTSFVMGLVSLGVGIPITPIAASLADLPGLVVAWAGIVGVNVAHGWGRRRPPRRG